MTYFMFVENNMIYKIIFSKNNYDSKAKKQKNQPDKERVLKKTLPSEMWASTKTTCCNIFPLMSNEHQSHEEEHKDGMDKKVCPCCHVLTLCLPS